MEIHEKIQVYIFNHGLSESNIAKKSGIYSKRMIIQ